ncbi:DUF3048 domain-containing protein [Candidatus Daviesbacteria bacterium]|nr:DUF3048 domain-containing protein [Candidatus Daviesbacteria bacterium]
MSKIIEIFENLTSLQKTLTLVILSVFVYAFSTSLSYSVFSGILKFQGNGSLVSSLPTASNIVEEDPDEPKTESCPLDGSMHTRKARESWEKRRPLAVMIENHTEARPQSGLSSANIVYEAVAEGGITRFMALFYCNLSDVQIGPVRSARTYYLDWLGEYDALYGHVGGANTPGPADALGQIIRYEIKDLNQFSIGFPVFWRDYQRLGHPVATEHTMYSTTAKLWEVGSKRGWANPDEDGKSWEKTFIPWTFKDESPEAQNQEVKVNFWESQPGYQVVWTYDSETNAYLRKNGDGNHMDLNNNQQLSASNVIVQFQREANANDGYPGNVHLLYGTTGSGKALIFQNGKAIEGKWVKQSRTARSKYLDQNGKEIEFLRGPIWIQTVPEGSKVAY